MADRAAWSNSAIADLLGKSVGGLIKQLVGLVVKAIANMHGGVQLWKS